MLDENLSRDSPVPVYTILGGGVHVKIIDNSGIRIDSSLEVRSQAD